MDDARTALDAIEPVGDAERADLATLRAVATRPGAWSRAEPIHLTASALVVHPATSRVLLRWHARQQAWLQLGGHGDPGELDPLAIARREAREESGLTDLVPWPDAGHATILHVVIVPVPANAIEPAHSHGDLRYVLATERPDDVVAEDEDAHPRWLTLPQAFELTTEENVRETLRRVGALLDRA